MNVVVHLFWFSRDMRVCFRKWFACVLLACVCVWCRVSVFMWARGEILWILPVLTRGRVCREVCVSERKRQSKLYIYAHLAFWGQRPVFTVNIARQQENIKVITATAWLCLYGNSDSSWCALLLPHTHAQTDSYTHSPTLTSSLGGRSGSFLVGHMTVVPAVIGCGGKIFFFCHLKCHSSSFLLFSIPVKYRSEKTMLLRCLSHSGKRIYWCMCVCVCVY